MIMAREFLCPRCGRQQLGSFSSGYCQFCKAPESDAQDAATEAAQARARDIEKLQFEIDQKRDVRDHVQKMIDAKLIELQLIKRQDAEAAGHRPRCGL